MAQKKTASKKGKATSQKGKAKSKGGQPGRYRLDSEGHIIGPNGRRMKLAAGDTPIIINGGSCTIISGAELDDNDNPGQKTRQLHAADTTKHITLVELTGFVAGTSPYTFVPTGSMCNIIIHYG